MMALSRRTLLECESCDEGSLYVLHILEGRACCLRLFCLGYVELLFKFGYQIASV